MALTVIRTLIIYFFVLFAIRLMGKSELSKLSPFQMVITFVIAELAVIPIECPSAPIFIGITAIAVLVFLQVLISFISMKSYSFKKFISGKPSLLIDKGSINMKELQKLRMSVNDLTEQLRLANAPSVSDVDFAIMEANGNLSVILKPDKSPLTAKDMSIEKAGQSLPCIVFAGGCVFRQNLEAAGYSEHQFTRYLQARGVSLDDWKSLPGEPFLIFCDDSRKFHIYKNIENSYAKEIKGTANAAKGGTKDTK